MKIFKCMQCGNMVTLLKEARGLLKCCETDMVELGPNTVDASLEKHVPVIKINEREVIITCGETLHPMEENHYIEFMVLETDKNAYFHSLKPGDSPVSSFLLVPDEKVIAAYAYCNLHGLWKSEMK